MDTRRMREGRREWGFRLSAYNEARRWLSSVMRHGGGRKMLGRSASRSDGWVIGRVVGLLAGELVACGRWPHRGCATQGMLEESFIAVSRVVLRCLHEAIAKSAEPGHICTSDMHSAMRMWSVSTNGGGEVDWKVLGQHHRVPQCPFMMGAFFRSAATSALVVAPVAPTASSCMAVRTARKGASTICEFPALCGTA